MQSHTLEYIVDATPEQIWRTLHPPRPPSEGPRVIEYAGGRIEIIQEGDETGKGLVRHCTFRVPRWLLSGGVGRSWECVIESRVRTSTPGTWRSASRSGRGPRAGTS